MTSADSAILQIPLAAAHQLGLLSFPGSGPVSTFPTGARTLSAVTSCSCPSQPYLYWRRVWGTWSLALHGGQPLPHPWLSQQLQD